MGHRLSPVESVAVTVIVAGRGRLWCGAFPSSSISCWFFHKHLVRRQWGREIFQEAQGSKWRDFPALYHPSIEPHPHERNARSLLIRPQQRNHKFSIIRLVWLYHSCWFLANNCKSIILQSFNLNGKWEKFKINSLCLHFTVWLYCTTSQSLVSNCANLIAQGPFERLPGNRKRRTKWAGRTGTGRTKNRRVIIIHIWLVVSSVVLSSNTASKRQWKYHPFSREKRIITAGWKNYYILCDSTFFSSQFQLLSSFGSCSGHQCMWWVATGWLVGCLAAVYSCEVTKTADRVGVYGCRRENERKKNRIHVSWSMQNKSRNNKDADYWKENIRFLLNLYVFSTLLSVFVSEKWWKCRKKCEK